MDCLYVYFENQRVGTLQRDREDVYQFTYDLQWELFPLSLSMPVDRKTFGNRVTRSFFENLLPEGDVRKNLEDTQDVSGLFQFLQEFGQDCAGAIVVSARADYQCPVRKAKRVEIDMGSVYQAISDNHPAVDIIAELDPGYLSLAGAQDKFPAIYENEKFYLPTDGSPTTHIVKTPIHRRGIKESVFNEYYCMTLAHYVGLNIPHCVVIQKKEPLFIIERYDREEIAPATVRRLHQQDFCQAQGLLSAQKYEIKGGPSIVDNYNLILESVTDSEKFMAARAYLDWICFNLVIGNNDSHSKNISLLLQHRKLSLAPFYDLLCTVVYEKLRTNFAFKIGGRDKFSEIGLQQFQKMEDSLGLKRGTFLEQLGAMSAILMDLKEIALIEAQEQFPDVKIFSRINEIIRRRVKGLANQKAI